MLHSWKNKQKQKEKGKETCSRLQAIEEKTGDQYLVQGALHPHTLEH